jgi:RHS repeat-associated protein
MESQTLVEANSSDAIAQCFAYLPDRPYQTAVTLPNSTDLEYSFTYDPSTKQLTRVIDAEGRTFRYEYTANRQVLRETGFDGAVTQNVLFDSVTGLPREIIEDINGAARRTQVVYDVFGHTTAIDRNGWGPDETFTWLDRLTLDRHELNHDDGVSVDTFTYLNNGHLRTVDDGETTTTFTYAADGRLRSLTCEAKAGPESIVKTCYRNRADGSISAWMDSLGLRRNLTRTFAENRERTTTTLVVASSEDCIGPLDDYVTSSLPTESVAEVDRDGLGRVVREEGPDGITVFTEYDGFGRVKAKVDEAENRMNFRYDDSGRLRARLQSRPDSPVPDSSNPEDFESVNDVRNGEFYSYDRSGMIENVTVYARAPNGAWNKASSIDVDYDVAGRERTYTIETEAGDYVVTQEMDGLGRVLEVTDNAGNERSIDFNSPTTWTEQVRGPEGTLIETDYVSNLLGNVVAVIDESGRQMVRNDYDERGRLSWAENEAEGGQQFTYDAFSRVTSIDARASDDGPLLERQFSTFDERGLRRTVGVGDRISAEYTYDVLGRVRRETRDANLPDHVVRYVGASTRLSRVTLPSGRDFTYRYEDPRGLLTHVEVDATDVPGVVGPEKLTRHFVSDDNGAVSLATVIEGETENDVLSAVSLVNDGLRRRLSEETDALGTNSRSYGVGGSVKRVSLAGVSRDYTYTLDGRFKAIRSGATNLVQMSYLGSGSAKTVQYNNGVALTRTFNARGQLLDEDGGANISLQYRYGADGFQRYFRSSLNGTVNSQMTALDELGRVTVELGNVSGTVTPGTLLTNSMVNARASQAEHVTRTSYDDAGNFSEVIKDLSVWAPTADEVNRYTVAPTGGSITYDDDGRVLSDGARVFDYDAFGNLAAVTGDFGTCTNEYDAFGRRTEQDCDGAVVLYGYDGANLAVVRSGGQTWTTFHASDVNAPLIQVNASSGQTRYFVLSQDRSVQTVLDSAGSILEGYAYTAFGDVRLYNSDSPPSANSQTFQSFLSDATGVYSMRARNYSPELGRFLSQDPIGALGGSHLYSFAHNNPSNFWDPFGLAAGANPAGASLTEYCMANPGASCARLMNAPVVREIPPNWSDNTEFFFIGPAEAGGPVGTTPIYSQADNVPWADRVPPEATIFRFSKAGSGLSMSQAYKQAGQAYVDYQKEQLIRGMTNVSIGVQLVPAGGDIASFGISTSIVLIEPSWDHAFQAGMDGVGAALPIVPSIGTLMRAERAAEAARGVGQIDDAASATLTVGRRGQQVQFPNPGAPVPRNTPGVVNGREFSGHAFDRMQERGFTPTVIENAVTTGRSVPGNTPGTLQIFDDVNGFSVIVNAQSGRIISVY